jgi:hypothetical protein
MNQTDLDLKDSPADEAKLQPQFTTIDMPEVSDIPGQENVHPPKMNQFADTTISSDDEEGAGILDSLNEPHVEDDLIAGDDADIPEDNDDDDEVPHDEDEEIDEDDDEKKEKDVHDMDADADVSYEERKILHDAEYSTTDEDDLNMQGKDLDDTDDDGDKLEEKSFKDDVTGSDLDVPGSEDDDADEEVGDEDEENNAYSGDDKNETK